MRSSRPLGGDRLAALASEKTEGAAQPASEKHQVREKIFSPVMTGAQPKDLGDTRYVITWKEVDGKKKEKRAIERKRREITDQVSPDHMTK